jgi:preprotein translocase subunit SecA
MQEQNKHMHIIDDELYFVIEEKNNVIELTEKGIDLITSQTDDPNFFILPDIGAEIAELEKANLNHRKSLKKRMNFSAIFRPNPSVFIPSTSC